MKKLLFISILFTSAFTSNEGYGQTDADALRYSSTSITGTARFTSMSGAFGALGGDFSTLGTNPGGIGVYRSSEFTFSPSVYVGSTTSKYLGNTTDDNKYNFNFGNIGLLFTNTLSTDDSKEGWKNWNFGFGYNRIANFHNRSYYEAKNSNNSMLDAFVQNSNGYSYDQLDSYFEYLAYSTYLINPDASNQYTSVIPFAQEIQKRSSETRGAIGETTFSLGGNYNNKLYLGLSLNFRTIRYNEESSYEEVDPDTTIPYFKSFQFDQTLATRGNGFNLKLGMIYRATDNVRLGLAIHTPTWYSMRDEYNNTMRASLDTGASQFAESPLGAYDYTLTTPFRVITSAAIVIGSQGLVSADYDFSDYSQSRFGATGFVFSETNKAIRAKYTGVHTVRIGTEWRYKNFSFRGGAAISTSPFNNYYRAASSDFSRKSFSAGLGIRDGKTFLDLGYVYTTSNEYFQPYSLNSQAVAGVENKVNTNNFVLTLGFKF